jgi:outer membrane lipoprotein SlyB
MAGFALGSAILPGIGSVIGTIAGGISGGLAGRKLSLNLYAELDQVLAQRRS